MGDKTGAMALCHFDYYLSHCRKTEQRVVNKFIANLTPFALLLPNVSGFPGTLKDYTMMRSPAQHLLSSSPYFLVTLHVRSKAGGENKIRLWNTNDGRCVMASQESMIMQNPSKIKNMDNHPGHILLLSKTGEVQIINVFTMMLLKHLCFEFKGIVSCKYKTNSLILCDSNGTIYILKDNSGPSPLKHYEQKLETSSILLELCSAEA